MPQQNGHSAAAEPEHGITKAAMGGYYEVITLQAGGVQAPSFGLGPGERKGDRARARALRLASRAQGADEATQDAIEVFPGIPGHRMSPNTGLSPEMVEKLRVIQGLRPGPPIDPPPPPAGHGPDPKNLVGDYVRNVDLQAGGTQSTSFGLGPGERKGDKPSVRDTYKAQTSE